VNEEALLRAFAVLRLQVDDGSFWGEDGFGPHLGDVDDPTTFNHEWEHKRVIGPNGLRDLSKAPIYECQDCHIIVPEKMVAVERRPLYGRDTEGTTQQIQPDIPAGQEDCPVARALWEDKVEKEVAALKERFAREIT
jgi:hypothetical protein